MSLDSHNSKSSHTTLNSANNTTDLQRYNNANGNGSPTDKNNDNNNDSLNSTNIASKAPPAAQLIQKGSGLQVVVGLGQSGLAAANYLINKGYTVAVTDANSSPKLANQLSKKVKIKAFGAIDAELVLRAERIIISPGVPLDTPEVAAAIEQGIAVVSDIQLFVNECHALGIPIVAITGSNAKSTVTTLVGQMAKDAGVRVGVGGNIGLPALSLLDGAYSVSDMQLAVLELSSFQLETVSNLGAKVATVLNMSPDHLDRHGDMLGYHQAKHRIFQGAQSIVTNRDDALTRPLIADDLPRISIGSNAPDMVEYGLIKDGDGCIYLAKGTQRLIDASLLKIRGTHNLVNALAALAIGELVDLPTETMLETLIEFTGLAHRCQFVTRINGVDYFNDSKGTNVGSTKAAIIGLGSVYMGMPDTQLTKLLLILGGQAKNQDFGELAPLCNQYVSQILLIGEDSDVISKHLQNAGLNSDIGLHDCETLEATVAKASDLTASSLSQVAAVLLSPACASFDQFSGFAERGERFCELVTSIQA